MIFPTSFARTYCISLHRRTALKFHMVWLEVDKGVEQGAMQGTYIISYSIYKVGLANLPMVYDETNYANQTSHLHNRNSYNIIQVMDYLVSFSCKISGYFILLSELVTGNYIYFIHKWFTCIMLLFSSHERGYFDTNNELLYAHKIFIDSLFKDRYPGKFEKNCKKKWCTPTQSIVYLEFQRLQIALFAPNTTCESCIK